MLVSFDHRVSHADVEKGERESLLLLLTWRAASKATLACLPLTVLEGELC